MSSGYRTDIHLKKLWYIHEQCASACKAKEELDAEVNIDNFTKLRRKIARDVRSIKADIHERNETDASGNNEALAAKQSHECGVKIKELGEDVNELSRMQSRRAGEINDDKHASAEEIEQGQLDFATVGFAMQHYNEVLRLERFGDDVEVNGLFKADDLIYSDNGYNGSGSLISGIPDIDDPQFKALAQVDAELDEDLDDILAAMVEVKSIAERMNGALKVQEEIIGNVNVAMERVEERVGSVNSSLKNVLKKVRGSREFFCDVLLCCVILGVGCAAIYLLSK